MPPKKLLRLAYAPLQAFITCFDEQKALFHKKICALTLE